MRGRLEDAQLEQCGSRRPDQPSAGTGHRVPRDYGDAFRVLAEVGVLDPDLAERMVSLAGARNLIVHLYAEVDDERLARSVRHGGLDDLDAFARRIAGLVV
ncbi:HepT-like ribonuclease domain-containing protein [Pseudonocardia sp.]|uniref:DUF86 domain-containing protein n=1 Tax=Pseudonocardia sp. TaxID=60912 RepID=UPI0026071F5A|nr:HepT-like ribonuclease domain-containing protein [Pseudonocardia sp.]